MAITPPSNRLWWKEPINGLELGWVIVAFLWGLFMFFFMIAWHFIGDQNLSNVTYRVSPDVYAEKVEAFADEFQMTDANGELMEEEGVPVVAPPEGGDVYLMARLWEFWPVLELKKDVPYRFICLQPIGSMAFRSSQRISISRSTPDTSISLR